MCVFVYMQVCPKDCLVCGLLSGKPWCNPNGCNSTHAYKSDDGTCVGEFQYTGPIYLLLSAYKQFSTCFCPAKIAHECLKG